MSSTLRDLRQTVASAGSWDRGRVDDLQEEPSVTAPDAGRPESTASGLDAGLCEARLAVAGGDGSRTSCRQPADAVSGEVAALRSLLGSKQSEAEELGALWGSFRQRKELLLQTVEDMEDKADHQSMKEPSLQALQHRSVFGVLTFLALKQLRWLFERIYSL